MILDVFANALTNTVGFSQALVDKLKPKYILLMFVSNWIITYLSIKTSYTAIFTIIFNLLIILLFTNSKAINGIVALISYIASVACNNLMLVFIQKVLKLDVPTLLSDKKALIIFYICFLIVVYLVSLIIRKLFILFVVKSDLSNSPRTLVLIFVELLLCATILIFNITYARQLGYPQRTILFNCLLFAIYFVLSSLLLISIVNSTRKNLMIQQELKQAKQLQEYTETIEYHANQMREFKHDYINILFTMDLLIQKSNYQPLIEYFEERIKPTGNQVKNINTNLVVLQHIKDTGIKSLLYNKLSYALSKGIDLHLYLDFDIDEFNMHSIDLARLLGIYLDNAIEGAMTSVAPGIAVVFTNKEGITIEISNNFGGPAPDLSRISEKGYSTKGEGRGLGLYQAQQIISQHQNIVHTIEVSDEKLIQSITFV